MLGDVLRSFRPIPFEAHLRPTVWSCSQKGNAQFKIHMRMPWLIDFLCASSDGPLYYVGREMKLSHRGLGINGKDIVE